ncbi:MAG: hypothetical protein GVY07_10360 [Bacteroidetes bacterium]|mgnify:CR=1 FL=1|jgi:low affinity Fe/Cu permease|uniref:Uncharacterized protein n=1 Tax=Rhodohalobacter sulfatireducens TaxID=2911366 RepID=A0ABS9KBT0_9BACT|nr:hypothetical protein [Rhodohalobacter sulfatireducens]MCG2588311.1 hypothetical protein [Rhodohalobacter sulfatireducens]MDR9365721.1 hypothetical protein [Balneolaceae bacterium]MDR9408651.1 hypothetical protein [Balneolaceae bacterium]NBC66042.1 hypothetical protein [Bacteroidota bacterium]
MKTWHWVALGILTVISLILEFTFLADYDSHWWNSIPGFYIIWGFLGCVAIIYVSKWLGKLFIFRPEQYYDR